MTELQILIRNKKKRNDSVAGFKILTRELHLNVLTKIIFRGRFVINWSSPLSPPSFILFFSQFFNCNTSFKIARLLYNFEMLPPYL